MSPSITRHRRADPGAVAAISIGGVVNAASVCSPIFQPLARVSLKRVFDAFWRHSGATDQYRETAPNCAEFTVGNASSPDPLAHPGKLLSPQFPS
jgi:hypothetical protein